MITSHYDIFLLYDWKSFIWHLIVIRPLYSPYFAPFFHVMIFSLVFSWTWSTWISEVQWRASLTDFQWCSQFSIVYFLSGMRWTFFFFFFVSKWLVRRLSIAHVWSYFTGVRHDHRKHCQKHMKTTPGTLSSAEIRPFASDSAKMWKKKAIWNFEGRSVTLRACQIRSAATWFFLLDQTLREVNTVLSSMSDCVSFIQLLSASRLHFANITQDAE